MGLPDSASFTMRGSGTCGAVRMTGAGALDLAAGAHADDEVAAADARHRHLDLRAGIV